MYDLNRLRLLRELQRLGTVRAVAEALHYSPSTVSQQLGVLESEAGVALLEPVGRRVELTAQGRILAAHADTMLAQLDLARADLARSVHEVTGRLRIAGFQTVLLTMMPAVLDDLAARHPHLETTLVQAEPEEAMPLLLSRRVDLVVAEEFPGHALPRTPGIRFEQLFLDGLKLALPDGDPDADDLRWETLKGRPWVAEREGAASRRWLLDLCREQGIEPEIFCESDDLVVHERLVASGHAVGVLPDLLVPGPGGSVRREIPGRSSTRRVLAVFHRDAAASPAIRACVESLRRHSPASA